MAALSPVTIDCPRCGKTLTLPLTVPVLVREPGARDLTMSFRADMKPLNRHVRWRHRTSGRT